MSFGLLEVLEGAERRTGDKPPWKRPDRTPIAPFYSANSIFSKFLLNGGGALKESAKHGRIAGEYGEPLVLWKRPVDP